MRRAVPVVVATAGGLALLASFHTTPEAVGTTAAARKVPPTTAPPTTARGSSSGATTTVPSSTASGPRTVDGPVVPTDYGDVQVRITVDASGRLTDVQALELPSDRSRSRLISQEAGPLLRSEALRAQSANIDIVSGASYTSEGYAASLQGALDRARR